jgi:hypothetical protein
MVKNSNFFYHLCRNPTFGRVWGWHSHSQNGDLGVLRNSRNFRVRLQGSKHLALKRYHVIGKLLKCRCQKWPHMSHLDICSTSYGKKEGAGVKLPVWLSTTKSRELTRLRCVQLESSKRELQVCFRPHPNSRSEQRVMNSQSPGSPNWDNFRTPFWESWDKKPFECGCRRVTQRILYGGRWWLSPSPGRGESCESKVVRGLS